MVMLLLVQMPPDGLIDAIRYGVGQRRMMAMQMV